MKVLVVKTSSLGDVVHTLPAITDLSANQHIDRLDWVVEEAFAHIPSWHEAVDNVIPMAWRRWRKRLHLRQIRTDMRAFFQKLRAHEYDVVIDPQGLLKSALIAFMAKGIRVGYDASSIKEPMASWFYNIRHGVSRAEHAILRMRQLFALQFSYTFDAQHIQYGIKAEQFYPTQDAPKQVLFIHGTSRQDKCWAPANWKILGQLIQETGTLVKVLWGSEAEHARAHEIVPQGGKVLPRLSLTEVASQLISSQGAVAVDTGIGHLAAALNVPCVSLYGPTDTQLIGTSGAYQAHATLDQSPQEVLALLRAQMKDN